VRLDKGVVVVQSGAVLVQPLRAALPSDQMSELVFKGGGQINLQDFGMLQQVVVDAGIHGFFGALVL
jgi:hypothetical protein